MVVDDFGDDAVEHHPTPGDNARNFRTAPALDEGDCGTWGRARDEQNGADLR